MPSWFSNLKDLSKDLSAKVQAAVESETFQKLTLSTPELTAQREALQQEYHHKVAVKDSLAHLYPWETRDPERDILVEECKEAIMGLSADVDTFFGPYEMPELKVKTDDDDGEEGDDEDDNDAGKETKNEGELGNDDDEDPEAAADDKNTRAVAKKVPKDRKPSQESLEKLSKLEPLPPLLAEFDLVAHVGLIQKMLKIDPKLVERQSTLSGGGEREMIFWRNYFFHCAYTRYEAGLSIDEIWSDEQASSTTTSTHTGGAVPRHHEEEHDNDDRDEVVHFSSTNTPPEPSIVDAFAATSINDGSPLLDDADDFYPGSHPETASPQSDYEIVQSVDGIQDEDAFDGEMDELEAEIAQALGD